jgi:hypothetical protein
MPLLSHWCGRSRSTPGHHACCACRGCTRRGCPLRRHRIGLRRQPQIDCLATDAFLDLDPWLEQPLTLQLRQADGALRQWHGCAPRRQLGSDGGLARYRLILEPWTALPACAAMR